MSDKLEWMEKHIILFKQESLKKLIEQEGYEVSEELEHLIQNDNALDFFNALIENKLYKNACDFLAYNLHKRAAIWWAYCCELELLEEIKIKQEKEIEKNKNQEKEQEKEMPEWLQDALKKGSESQEEAQKKYQELLEQMDKIKIKQAEFEKTIDPKLFARFKQKTENIYKEIEKETGIYLPKFREEILQKAQNYKPVDHYENSDLKKEMDNLNQKLNTMKEEIKENIELYFPKKDTNKQKEKIANALNSVYAWIISPDEENSKRVFKASVGLEDKAEGLLALSAFWASGDLNLGGDIIVKAPNAMVSNGIKSVLIKLAFMEGETKPKQRYEKFFEIGMEIAYGKNNWEESLSKNYAPHEYKFNLNSNKFETKNKRFNGEIDE